MHTFCGGKVSYQQALDGMSGAIVIDGIDRHMPEVRTIKERIFNAHLFHIGMHLLFVSLE
jgi:hypothetical protein